MGSIVEFEGLKTHPNFAGASNLILTRPLNSTHLDRLAHIFENYRSEGLWYGYAILDRIPELLSGTVVSKRIKTQLGAALFCSTKDPILFLFRDLEENFRVLTRDGHTLIMEDHIESVLAQLHNIRTA